MPKKIKKKKIITSLSNQYVKNQNKTISKKKNNQNYLEDKKKQCIISFPIIDHISNITNKKGQIRIGRRIGNHNPQVIDFKPIIIMMKSHSKKWYPLSPYALKNEANQIMENIWQSAKTYETVPKSTQYYSRYQRRVIWDHPAETHIDKDGEPNKKYWAWRNKLLNHNEAVRYPVGIAHRRNALYSLIEKGGRKLDYIEARLHIYEKVYIDLIQLKGEFYELVDMVNKGINILIIEPDGPHQESLEHYNKNYSISPGFIENDSMVANKENLNIMLNDPKHSYGHGYCLARAILEQLQNK